MSNLVAVSQRDIIRITWTPPFSLDITGVDLDMWYRVEVYNITNRRVTLTNHSVYVPEFNFNVPNASPHDQFEFRVTPINTAGNGTTSHPVSGRFLGSKFFVGITHTILGSLVCCLEKGIEFFIHTV